MAKVTNTQIFGLDESIYRSGYPMLSQAPAEEEFHTNVNYIRKNRLNKKYDIPHIKRAIQLAQTKGAGHDQFLTGITVTMDLTLSNKAWVEAERYKFLNFISSMSSMHRVAFFKIGDCCNDFVTKAQIAEAEKLQKQYNDIDGERYPEQKKIAYLNLLYNIPSGFELMSGMITNYRCLKNMRAQRRNHRLWPDWGVVCDWIDDLPMAKELIIRRNENESN